MSSKKTVAELQAELEDIIAWFESDDVDIDKAAAEYERGLKISEELRTRLKQTENNIKKLKESFHDKS